MGYQITNDTFPWPLALYLRCYTMQYRVLIILLLSSSFAFGQKADAITLHGLQKILQGPSDKILVINFWATWCAPCIKELPLFEKLNTDDRTSEVILVSMDYDLDPDPAKVDKFIARKKLQSKVLFLKANDPGSWIDKIEKKWSGALPATLVINTKTGKREFVQGEVGEGQLEKLLKAVTN